MAPRTGIKCTTHPPRLLPMSVDLSDDNEIVEVFANSAPRQLTSAANVVTLRLTPDRRSGVYI